VGRLSTVHWEESYTDLVLDMRVELHGETCLACHTIVEAPQDEAVPPLKHKEGCPNG
jgi:hypothetical protein